MGTICCKNSACHDSPPPQRRRSSASPPPQYIPTPPRSPTPTTPTGSWPSDDPFILYDPYAAQFEQPVTQLPGQPITQVLGQPITQVPGQPITQVPGQPVAQVSGQPVSFVPGQVQAPGQLQVPEATPLAPSYITDASSNPTFTTASFAGSTFGAPNSTTPQSVPVNNYQVCASPRMSTGTIARVGCVLLSFAAEARPWACITIIIIIIARHGCPC